jgi:hypothetical protein
MHTSASNAFPLLQPIPLIFVLPLTSIALTRAQLLMIQRLTLSLYSY